MKSKSIFLLSALMLSIIVSVLISCNKPCETEKIKANIDNTYAYVADLTIEQLKIVNQNFEDSKITEAINEYSKIKTVEEKNKFVDRLQEDDLKRCPKVLMQTINFISQLDSIGPEQFDLAIKNNDYVAQQVKLMNGYFGSLEKSTLNAISFYDKLSKDEKIKLFSNEGNLPPSPDYAERLIAREFQKAYYYQQYLVYQRLNRYLLQRTYIREFPQGFNQTHSTSYYNDDKQFDLAFVQQVKN